MASSISSIRRPTLIEILIIVAIVALLFALLLPGTQWVADGTIDVPVRVLVFDAGSAQPIANADVLLFRCGPWRNQEFLNEFQECWTPKAFGDVQDPLRSITNLEGEAVISYRFNTSSSSKNPTPRAVTWLTWAAVRADGYGGATLQLREESTPTAVLRADGELRLAVGLLKSASEENGSGAE